MINLLYISRINLSSGRTNVYNLAKTCEALNTQPGVKVELITTDQPKDLPEFFQRMGVHRPFLLTCLGLTNTESKYSGKSWYEMLMFLRVNVVLAWLLWRRSKKVQAVYFRDDSLFVAAFVARKLLRKEVFFEIHSLYERWYRQLKNVWSAKSASGVVAISSGLQRHYQQYNSNIIVSLCSAAEDIWFDYIRSQAEIRKSLNLPLDRYLIGYTGVVGINPNNDYYEIDDIIRGLLQLPQEVVAVIVGESHNNAEWLRQLAKEIGVESRVIIVPWQERRLIAYYLQAFDINLIPKRKKDLIGDSPAKMFPALAADRPIVAGRAECIEEVLTNNDDALIVATNSPTGWAAAILQIYSNKELGERLAQRALITKTKYTWEKRGEAIADFITKTFLDHELAI